MKILLKETKATRKEMKSTLEGITKEQKVIREEQKWIKEEQLKIRKEQTGILEVIVKNETLAGENKSKLEERCSEREGKMDRVEKEWQELRKGLEEGGCGTQDPGQEELWKEVEELRKWKEEQENKEARRGDREGVEEEEAAQGIRLDRRNWRDLEWITEEREREKRKNNVIIVGLKNDRKYSRENVEEWLKRR